MIRADTDVDPDLSSMYDADSNAYSTMAYMIERGDVAAATKEFDNLDTAAKDHLHEFLEETQAADLLELFGYQGMAGGGKAKRIADALRAKADDIDVSRDEAYKLVRADTGEARAMYQELMVDEDASDLAEFIEELSDGQVKAADIAGQDMPDIIDELYDWMGHEELGETIGQFMHDKKTGKLERGGKVGWISALRGGRKKKPKAITAHFTDKEGYHRRATGGSEDEARENLRKLIHEENEGAGEELLQEFGVTFNHRSHMMGLTEGSGYGDVRKQIEDYLVEGHWPRQDAEAMSWQFDFGTPETFDPLGATPNRVEISAPEDLMKAFEPAADVG